MAKKKTGDLAHRCSKCGYTQARWLGRCPECGEWNTFEEVTINQDYSAAERSIAEKFVKEAHSVPLDAIEANDAVRLSTGIAEFDRVLGGGAVKRSAILIGGEPGIGKSTLLLQAASASSSGSVKKVLYVSGEESGGQIRSRADRLNLPLKNILNRGLRVFRR